MKVCVTGGAGYIGSHTCKALAEAGHEVVVFDNLCTGHRNFVKWGIFEYGDIRDTNLLRHCLKKYSPDGIIHFAATSQVSESVIDPGKYFSNNVTGTLSVLEAMRDEGVPHIVLSGTCAIYGQPEKTPINENAAKKPISPYGASKLFIERMLADFEKAHGINWTSLRYFNAAGSSPDGEIGELHFPETHLIPRVILAALGKIDKVEVFGDDYPTYDGSCVRDYIDVADLARAHIIALEKLTKGASSQALNLGTGKGTSVFEIIKGVEEVAGKKIPLHISTRREGDPASLTADASLAFKELGWKADISLGQTLENAYKFLANNKFMGN